MNIFDKAVGYFNPAAGARRAAWRLRAEMVEKARRYDGASRDKRLANWNPGTKTADAILRREGPTLRARAYDLVRNSAHAANIVSKHADYIVGDGITPKFKTGNDTADAALKEKWSEFSRRIDPQGVLNFDAMTRQMVRGMISGGEMFARRRDRRLTDGLEVPLQIQVLEAEYIDSSRLQTYAQKSKNTLVSGIEFDAIGSRRGYWFHKNPPSSDLFSPYIPQASTFVPAEQVAHLYEPLRTQVRGETWLAPVMTDIRDLDEYDLSERIRKKTEACLVGVITDAEDAAAEDDPNIGLPVARGDVPGFDELGQPIVDGLEEDWPITDLQGDPVERFEPGMFYNARSGSKVEFNTPATSAGYDTYTRTQLRKISAGARMPYEIMTGDLSEVTFASGRMGRLDYKRFVETVQYQIVIPMWGDVVVDWFLQTLRTLGTIPATMNVTVEWQTPVFETITPIDDINADKMSVRAGFLAWDDVVTRRGYDPDAVAAKIVERNKFWDANNVVLDIDPRRTSNNGQIQSAAATGDEPNAPGEQEREEANAAGRASSARLAAIPGGKAGQR